MRTRFTDLVGCRLPFQLAVMAGVGTLELARAVADAGGLGMVPSYVDLPEPRDGAFGKGFLIPYLPALDHIVENVRGLRVAEFFWGAPDADLVAGAHLAGCLVSWQVGSAEEARAAAQAGCDFVVIQGIEAGGHVRGAGPLDALLAETVDAVSVPVVAAGGVGSAERVAQLLAAGADAVRVGTRFLACPECDTHEGYVRALIDADAGDTVLTDQFDDGGRWPGTVRVLRSSVERAVRAGNRSTLPPNRGAQSPLEMPCYAGESVEDLREVKSARAVVEELTSLLD